MAYCIITISRQYGYGIRTIGRQLPEQLGLTYYDKELIRMIVEESGYAVGYVKEQSEYALTSGLDLMPVSHGALFSVPVTGLVETPSVTRYLNDFILKIVEEHPRTTTGCSADHILRDRDDVLSVSLYADVEACVKTLLQRGDEATEDEARKRIEQSDRACRKNYKQLTNREWGESTNYHLRLNMGASGAPCCTDIVAHAYQLPCGGVTIGKKQPTMQLTDNWSNGLAESGAGQTAYLYVRDELEEFHTVDKYRFVVEIAYPFNDEGIESSDTGSAQIEVVDELLQATMERDKMAIFVASILESVCKVWLYVSRTYDPSFDRLEEVLAELPLLPLQFEVVQDPDWDYYQEPLDKLQPQSNKPPIIVIR